MYRVGSKDWPGLSKLSEEMAELGVEFGKLIENGGKRIYQWNGVDLHKNIMEELADVMATAEFFAKLNFTEEENKKIQRRKKNKIKKYKGWRASDA